MLEAQTTTSYNTTFTATGKWMHAPGSDFIFAYIDNSWDKSTKAAVASAFENALGMSSKIKAAVKKTSGQTVVNGLYTLDQAAMTKAMNSIQGMGMTTADVQKENGEGTTTSINLKFFTTILAGLGGDVSPMMDYLNKKMGELQAQTKKSKAQGAFGTVIGMIGVMPTLNIPVTTFKYAYSNQTTKEWFTKLICGEAKHYSYDYSFTEVDYNYNDPSGSLMAVGGNGVSHILEAHKAFAESHRNLVSMLKSYLPGVAPQALPVQAVPHEVGISLGVRTEEVEPKHPGAEWLVGNLTVDRPVENGFSVLISNGIRLQIREMERLENKSIFQFSYDGNESRRNVTEAFERGKEILISRD